MLICAKALENTTKATADKGEYSRLTQPTLRVHCLSEPQKLLSKRTPHPTALRLFYARNPSGASTRFPFRSMNILKRIFARLFGGASAPTSARIPFKPNEIQYREKYILAVARIVADEESLEMLRDGKFIFLEFGGPSSVHILYFGLCDLSILMTPESDGWSAQQVYVDRGENMWMGEGMEFLFQYLNPLANDPPVIDNGQVLVTWGEYAKVYAHVDTPPVRV